jgi:Rrf2 family iron-sulfur cluster assembly transcriptional regulator
MPVPLAHICERQQVSQSYLEHIFRKLRETGLVVSFHGPGGGYRLGRQPDRISISDIIDAIDQEVFDCRTCNGSKRDPKIESCITNGLWCRVNDEMYGHLRSVTLDSILDFAGVSPNLPRRAIRTATAEFEYGGSQVSSRRS